MKKTWRIVIAVALVAAAAWMLWPRPLEEAFDATEQFSVTGIMFDVENGQLKSESFRYEVEAGSAQGREIEAVLEKYSYHACIDTLVGVDSIWGPVVTMNFHNTREEYMTLTVGTRRLHCNGRVYRLGYGEIDRGRALCDELLAILEAE